MVDTREIATGYRLEYWAGIVRERAESGLTVKAFCESEEVHPNAYSYWQRKPRESACERLTAGALPSPNGWTVVMPADPRTPATYALTVEIGKCSVLVGMGADERLFAKVCRVLIPLC